MGPTPISVEGLDGVVPMRLRDVAPEVNRITGSIVDSSLAVQRALGSRLLEKPYEIALTHELSLRGHRVQRQVPIEVEYRGLRIGNAYFADLLVDETVAVELKAVADLDPDHFAQFATCLRFGGFRVDILINFHASPLKAGIRRVVLSP